jgi:hypothetical protein
MQLKPTFRMKRLISLASILFYTLFSSFSINAQDKNYEFYGNVRIAHIGADTEVDGIGGDNTLLRLRPGIRYNFNENHSFSGRLVYLVSKELESPEFTTVADGNSALAYGSISFDEFYYQYRNADLQIKAGRFQKTINVMTNSKRSHLRFQSNAIFVHWTDGLYLKKDINDNWFGEAIVEYQNKDAVTYPYSGTLTFQNNEHNFNYYLGVESQTRDQNNVIQKGFGIFIAPNAYLKPDGFTTYAAISSRIAIDIPKEEVLKGGSIRIAGELGQNLNTDLSNGTSAVASIGINNFADKHEIMLEFAKTDAQWLTATAYGNFSDEVELRYRYFFTDQLNFDIRYRVREVRNNVAPTMYSTFLRLTYSW